MSRTTCRYSHSNAAANVRKGHRIAARHSHGAHHHEVAVGFPGHSRLLRRGHPAPVDPTAYRKRYSKLRNILFALTGLSIWITPHFYPLHSVSLSRLILTN